MSKTPRTDNIARGNHVVPTEWAEQLEREMDEAREAFVIATDQMVQAQCKTREALRERDEARELVKAYQEYTNLLVDEINDMAAVAYVHGWRTNRYEQGKVLRDKIKRLEETK